MEISCCQSTVLGKRKAKRVNETLVLRLTSPISTDSQLPGPSDSEWLPPNSSKSRINAPILTNGSLVAETKKCYHCTYHTCGKAYSKRSRLEEHERSHTGQVRLVGHLPGFCELTLRV